MGWIVLSIFVFVIVALIGMVIGIYNHLVRVKHNVDKAWANIDVLLKQRHDELPKLVETCKGYMEHEKSVLENVTKARTGFMNATTVEGKAQAENMLTGALKSLFAVAENYPDLKANTSFNNLQNRISALENEISDRREFFNESVNIYNIRIEQFPDVILANMLNYPKMALLDIPADEKTDVDIKF